MVQSQAVLKYSWRKERLVLIPYSISDQKCVNFDIRGQFD